MEIHQLRYFVAVAQEGGFSLAAERVHVAQPSLSQQMESFFTNIAQDPELPGYEDFERQAWGFKVYICICAISDTFDHRI